MNNRQKLIVTAVSSALALSTLALPRLVGAQADDAEKCYGVVKAGKNDCAGPGHTCQGQARADSSPNEFILLPAGTCERLTGGELK